MGRKPKARRASRRSRPADSRDRRQVEAGARRYRDLCERLQANSVANPDVGIWIERKDGPEWSPCWIWLGGKNANGYGLITIWDKKKKKNRQKLAHRVAFFAFKGLSFSPKRPLIMHKCDSRACIQPDHTDPGTQRKNMAHMMERGRGANQHGPYVREREPGEDDE